MSIQGNIRVSDQALLRFLERAGGMAIEELRAALEGSLGRAYAAARSLTDSDHLIKADGLLYVVRGDTVVTVIEDGDGKRSALTLQHPQRGAGSRQK